MTEMDMVETTIPPMDEYNRALVSNVHPADWVNPEPARRYNLVVIGAGTAGLVAAAGAASLGAKVALIEKHFLGGDCLNVGCVPSKCLIRSSRAYTDVRNAHEFGVRVPEGVDVDFPAAMERMRSVRSRISYHDSAQRFRQLGVDVFLGEGRFTGPDTIDVKGKRLCFKKAVLAMGGRPAAPTIPGLAETGYLTNETVFSLVELPKRLAVIGAGPIGCELAQAFQRFGSKVSLLHTHSHILKREDPDAAEIVQRAFIQDGVRLLLGGRILNVEKRNDDKLIQWEGNEGVIDFSVDEILVGVGRAPNVQKLNLEAAGVKYQNRPGVEINPYLQTSNPRIYAAGDICFPYKFTHTADALARIVIQNALFLGRKKHSLLTIPWCTYTDPEIAHVGMYEKDAQAKGIEVHTLVRPLKELDRAITDGEEEGLLKVHLKKGTDKILGATLVARHAGEMISEITLAMVSNIGLSTLATVIHPYPTQAEAIKQLGDAYNRTRLTPLVKKALSLWLAWTR